MRDSTTIQYNPKDILIQVLTFTGYEDDKNAYATEFIQNCEKQALVDLLIALPQEEQEAFKQQIEGVSDQEGQKAIIAKYITPDQYKEALQKASQTAFQSFIEEIIPTLSTEQSTNLQTYLNSLHFSNNATPEAASI